MALLEAMILLLWKYTVNCLPNINTITDQAIHNLSSDYQKSMRSVLRWKTTLRQMLPRWLEPPLYAGGLNNREKTDTKSNPWRMLLQSISSDAFSRSARRDRHQEVVGSTGKWWSASRTNTGPPSLHSRVSFAYVTSRENHSVGVLIHHPSVRCWLIYVSTDGQYYCVRQQCVAIITI